MVAEPEVFVEIAWTDNYAEVNPVWSDITDYVETIDTNIGRSNEIGALEAGTVSLLINNSGGEFTPDNPASPFYPNVKPMKQIRVYAKDENMTEWPIYRGAIERWPAAFGSAGSSMVTVTATDWLAYLGDDELEPAFQYELDKTTPTNVFTFGESSDSKYFSSQTDPFKQAKVKKTRLWGAMNFDSAEYKSGSANLIPYGAEGKTSLKLTGATRQSNATYSDIDLGYYVNVPRDHLTNSTDSWSYAGYFQLDDLPAGTNDMPCAMMVSWDGDHANRDSDMFAWIIYDPAYDNWLFQVFQEETPGDPVLTNMMNIYLPFGGLDPIGRPIYMGMGYDAPSGTFHCIGSWGEYVSWYDNLVPASPIKDFSGKTRAMFMGYSFPKGSSGGLMNGSIQYLAEWDRAVTPDEYTAIYAAGQGRIGETTDERIDYILDVAGWPSGLRNLGAERTEVERTSWQEGASALEKIREAADDAMGLFYADASGVLTYQERDVRSKAVSKWTLDNANGTAVESGLVLESAASDVKNIAKVDNAYGVKTTLTSDASVTEYGKRITNVDLRITNQDEAIQHGYHMIRRYDEPTVRVNSLRLNAGASSDGRLWPVVLGLALSDMVTVGDLPDGAPSSTMTFFVESIRHHISREGESLGWVTDMDVSPTGLRDAWILGDPVRGVLGSTTILHF